MTSRRSNYARSRASTPGAVSEFLARHREELAPRVRREVESKLNTGLKRPR